MVSGCALVVTANSFSERLIGLDLIERGSSVALGVSGGGDSVAMLHAVGAWAKAQDCAVYVFTVDHNLRAESADEAAFVARICAELGITHKTLVWDVPKPSQNAARQARHRLLADACRDVGARYLFLGHTLDDVIETTAMRAARGEAAVQDAGPLPVSVSPVWPEGRGVMVVRPLILSRRSVLREWLQANMFEWVDDPSNESDAYERPRVRKALAETDDMDAGGTTVRALQARARDEVKLAPALQACTARCDGFGLVRVFAQIDPVELEALIPILVPAAAGTDRIPKAYARLSAMTEMLEPDAARYTIGGAWLQRSADDILIGREPTRDGYAMHGDVFDGRFERDLDHALPDHDAPYLLRHALPPERDGWRSLISARLEAHAVAFEANAGLLTRPRVSGQS